MAGRTPFPVDPLEVRIAQDAAKLMWRACPYFEWRYGERGRAFGRSDAGYMVTLAWLSAASIDRQLNWQIRLLAPRGMPGVLVELQLQILGRIGRKLGWSDHRALASAAERLGAVRADVLPDAVLHACERNFQATARGLPHAFGTGFVIAGAVADSRIGVGDHHGAILDWFVSHGPSEPRWREACRDCFARASDAR